MMRLMLILIIPILSLQGAYSAGVTLTVNGSQASPNTVVCGSTTSVECELDSPPSLFVEWFANDTLVSHCETTGCVSNSNTPPHYNVTKHGDTVYILTIDPVAYSDSRSIFCQKDTITDSNSIAINVEARLENGGLTESSTVANGNLRIEATTNCVSKPNDVSIKLQYKQGNDDYKDLIDSSNNAYKDFVTSTTSTCTDAENPNCGGTATSKKVFTIKTPTNTNGQSYDVRLVYTDSGGSITREIGPFEIDTTILEPSGGTEHNDLTRREIIVIVCGCLVVLTVLIASVLITWRYFETRNKRKEVTVSLQQISEKVKTKTGDSKDIQETEELIRKIKGGLTTNSERTRNKDSKIVLSKVQLELQQILKEIGENKVRKDILAPDDDENLDDSIRQLRDLLSKIFGMESTAYESVEREGFGGKTNRKLPPIHSTKTATFHVDSP